MKKLSLLSALFLLLSFSSINASFAAENKKENAKPAAKETLKQEGNPKIVLETDFGKMIVELYPKKAPVTVKNFLHYIDSGFYDGTIFHRVVPNFVVQGGGFTFDFVRKETEAPIENESNNGLKNLKGTLSMARLPNPNSATSQFFINIIDNPHLDPQGGRPGYAVFAKVIEGFEIVKKIEKEPRGLYRSHPEAPNFKPRILKAYRLKK